MGFFKRGKVPKGRPMSMVDLAMASPSKKEKLLQTTYKVQWKSRKKKGKGKVTIIK